jgi:transposase-like protein
MRYSYEFKRKCVELYRQGNWPNTPEGVNEKIFRKKIIQWYHVEEACGPEALKPKAFWKAWTPEEKLELVLLVLAGKSLREVSYSVGMDSGTLYQWVRKYKLYGYNGLVNAKRGRIASKESLMNKSQSPEKLTESEREELIRLRARTAYLEAENELIKKEIALREEKEAARLKAKKQQSSKNLEKKGTN